MTTTAIFIWVASGLKITLMVTAGGLLIAAPFAFMFGILQYRASGLPRFMITCVIEFWRSSSLIILLFAFFYVLPVAGVRLNPLTVGCMVLGCHIGALGTQAVRGALASVGAGQIEAARALGLSRNKILFLVELPQALRTMVPIFGSEAIELIKSTANVSLITLAEMTFRAKELMQVEHRPATIYTILILLYVAMCAPVALLAKVATDKLAKPHS